MEKLLHYVWKHRLYEASRLLTTEGEEVEVIDAGQHNMDAGPDFFNAKVRIDGVVWAGHVEIHCDERDWYAHHHDEDEDYENTILHVVERRAESEHEIVEKYFPVRTASGKRLKTIVITVPASLRKNYERLLKTEEYPRCHEILPSLSPLMVHSWLSSMLVERLDERARAVGDRAERLGGDWERAFFITLARNFGFGKNGDEMEQWATALPLASIVHHRDNMFQVEAMFLGTAGLLEKGTVSHAHEAATDEYRQELLREYDYLCKKFRLERTAEIRWNFLRMRPQSFPHIRLVQLADIYCRRTLSLSSVIERSDDVRSLSEMLDCSVSDYWQTHYTFGCQSARSSKRLSAGSRRLIVINTVVPVLWAYADHMHRPELKERALAILEHLPSEDNYILRQWRDCGVKVDTAADSQALIQLKRTRCDRYDCLRCRFAYQILKKPT